MSTDLRLNLGCGLQAPAGWINVDRSPSLTLDRVPGLKRALGRLKLLSEAQLVPWPSNIVRVDLTKPLPYADGSIDAIYSSHTLEHLYLDDARRLLAECRRVLRVGGVIRLALPDAFGMASQLVHAQAGDAAAAALDFTRQLNMGPMARPSRKQKLLGRVSSSQHRWQPTTALALDLMAAAGFENTRATTFLEGDLPDLATIEHRAESLFVEATR